jgi:hypothetical protein
VANDREDAACVNLAIVVADAIDDGTTDRDACARRQLRRLNVRHEVAEAVDVDHLADHVGHRTRRWRVRAEAARGPVRIRCTVPGGKYGYADVSRYAAALPAA